MSHVDPFESDKRSFLADTFIALKKEMDEDNKLLQKAIDHAEEVAERATDACSVDHSNLAKWLKELYQRRCERRWG